MLQEKRFIILGAGMSGILAAIKLKEAGCEHVTVLEKADRIGGTWRENVYPGLTCDVPAHCYTYEFAPNPEWSAYHAPGPEIQAYFEKVVDDWGVRPLIRFNAEVTRCEWQGNCWEVETRDGTTRQAEFVIAATGVLHYPRYPEIPGLESFAGRTMHTAKWDRSFPLAGKRLGIIGNGSTGVQMVCNLAPQGIEIVHFQRTPQWIMPVPTFAYSDEDRAVFRASLEAINAVRYDAQYWSNIRRFTTGVADPASPQMQEIEAYCLMNLEQSVRDPALREKLRPTYRAACKRLIYSSDYYEHAQRPNVTNIVCGIAEVVPEGIRDNEGALHRLDVIALATGYHSDRFVRPVKVIGAGGRDIEEVWRERCTAYLAVSIPDFPNFFMLNGPTSPVGNFSLIDTAEKQWAYIEQLLARIGEGNARGIAVSQKAFAAYEDARITRARQTIFGSGCASWYLDKTGVPITWPWDYDAFADAMKAPDFEAFEVI
jgi:cation diffusion facilitator CzcD-associated flavoprotein CzcO